MTNKKRLGRIKRLIRVSETRRDAAEAALARAQVEVATAEGEVAFAQNRLDEGAARLVQRTAQSAADFVDAYAFVRSLSHEVNAAEQAVEEAEAHRLERLATAKGAYREVRKMEIWGESTEERHRVEQARTEQKTDDELAARMTTRREQ